MHMHAKSHHLQQEGAYVRYLTITLNLAQEATCLGSKLRPCSSARSASLLLQAQLFVGTHAVYTTPLPESPLHCLAVVAATLKQRTTQKTCETAPHPHPTHPRQLPPRSALLTGLKGNPFADDFLTACPVGGGTSAADTYTGAVREGGVLGSGAPPGRGMQRGRAEQVEGNGTRALSASRTTQKSRSPAPARPVYCGCTCGCTSRPPRWHCTAAPHLNHSNTIAMQIYHKWLRRMHNGAPATRMSMMSAHFAWQCASLLVAVRGLQQRAAPHLIGFASQHILASACTLLVGYSIGKAGPALQAFKPVTQTAGCWAKAKAYATTWPSDASQHSGAARPERASSPYLMSS